MRGLLHPLERRSGWLGPGEGGGRGAVLRVQTGPDADVGRTSGDPGAGGEAEVSAGGGGLRLVMLEQGRRGQGGLVLGEGGHRHRVVRGGGGARPGLGPRSCAGKLRPRGVWRVEPGLGGAGGRGGGRGMGGGGL